MFHLTASLQPRCLQTAEVSKTKTHLWHRRFAHLNFKGLYTLANKQMVIGLPSLKPPKEICTTCLVGKQHRDMFSEQSTWRASSKLQLIHADIFGPMRNKFH